MHVACYLPCLTQICEALIYSSPAADCCCKAVYWPRPTMMPHPSIAAAWPTFIACHTVAAVPVSGDKPKEKPNSYWKAHTLKEQNSKCSINSSSQITNLGFTVKRYHFLTWKPQPKLHGRQAETFVCSETTATWHMKEACLIRQLLLDLIIPVEIITVAIITVITSGKKLNFKIFDINLSS